MQPVEKDELKRIVNEAKAEGKDVSELEKIISQDRISEPKMGEMKVKEVMRESWMKMDTGSERKKQSGKVVILSTGPAKEGDFL